MIPITTNVYIFLYAALGIYLFQLCVYLTIVWLGVLLVGWPIKLLFKRLKQLIDRAGKPVS